MLEIPETNVTDLGKLVIVAAVVLLALRRLRSWPRRIPKGTTGLLRLHGVLIILSPQRRSVLTTGTSRKAYHRESS